MSNLWTGPESLTRELSWRFPLSYRTLEKTEDETLIAVFEKRYRLPDEAAKWLEIEIQIPFYPDGEGEYLYGAVSFHGEELPPDEKQAEVAFSYSEVLFKYGWKPAKGFTDAE